MIRAVGELSGEQFEDRRAQQVPQRALHRKSSARFPNRRHVRQTGPRNAFNRDRITTALRVVQYLAQRTHGAGGRFVGARRRESGQHAAAGGRVSTFHRRHGRRARNENTPGAHQFASRLVGERHGERRGGCHVGSERSA